jgi:hypothetical protein
MRAERNPANQFGLNTPYRRYMTICNTIKFFNEPLEIQRLFDHALEEVIPDSLTLNAESKRWYEEIEQNADQVKFEVRPVSEQEIKIFDALESYLDSPSLPYAEDIKSSPTPTK